MDDGERKRREAHINARAFELATSGRHVSPLTIISQLASEGYPEAEELLNTDLIRNDLRELCQQHWAGRRILK